MKIVGCMIVYNGMPFLPYAIQNVRKQVDHLIIVYGAQKEFADLPKDGTNDYLWKIINQEDPNIDVIIDYWDSECEQRNMYLQWIKDNDLNPDWLLIIDSDEFYTNENFKSIKECANTPHSEISYILYPFYNFYYDFHNYKINKNGMLKFIRYSEDLKYWDSRPQVLDNIGDSENKTLWHKSHAVIQNIDRQKIPRCYHYPHLSYTPYFYRAEIEKLVGSCTRDKYNPEKAYFNSLKSMEDKKKWIHENYRWLDPEKLAEIGCQKFDGEHPRVITENFITTANYIKYLNGSD